MKELSEVEKRFAVDSIRANGKQVWPFLRWYAVNKMNFGGESLTLSSNKISLRDVVKNVFHGFMNLFTRKSDFIFFSDTSERKRIGNQYHDKSVEYLAQRLANSLYFELPLPNHFKRSEVPTRNLVSKLPLYILVKLITYFTGRVKIENEELLKQILSRFNVQLDYRGIIRTHLAQYTVARWLIKIYKPKKLILQCYYTNMGYVKAFRDSGRDVIEVQHGLISKNHEAYNIVAPLDNAYFPSHLLVYGHRDKEIFTPDNQFINPTNVIVVGSYYLDTMAHAQVEEEVVAGLRAKYAQLVAVTSQKYIEDELIEFVKAAANLDPAILFVFIPREILRDYAKTFEDTPNITLIPSKNTYEIIALCDVHCTVNSTCAIEAPSLGTPNILLNIRNLSRETFGGVFADESVSRIAETPGELIQLLNTTPRHEKRSIASKNEKNFKSGYKQNIEAFLSSEIFTAK